MATNTLAGIIKNSTNDSARVTAIALMYERGWGKVAQPTTTDGQIEITIRQIIEDARTIDNYKTIEGHSHDVTP
jgi:hypothetical protein